LASGHSIASSESGNSTRRRRHRRHHSHKQQAQDTVHTDTHGAISATEVIAEDDATNSLGSVGSPVKRRAKKKVSWWIDGDRQARRKERAAAALRARTAMA
jgi:hypothetical protein